MIRYFMVNKLTPPPVITSLNYTQGDTAGGGAPIIITGSGFTGVNQVSFLGTAATSFTVVNDTQISASLPAHTAGSGDLVVSNAAGSSTSSFEYWSPSAIGQSGFWKAPYSAPWASEVSGGSLYPNTDNWPSYPQGTPPASDQSLQGKSVAHFDPSYYHCLTTPYVSTAYLGNDYASHAGWFLVRVDDAGSQSAWQNQPSLLGTQGTGRFAMSLKNSLTSGIEVTYATFDNSDNYLFTTTIPTSEWTLLQYRYDFYEKKKYMRVNGESWVNTSDVGPNGGIGHGGGYILDIGRSLNLNNYLNGAIAELGVIGGNTITDSNFDKLLAYSRQAYGLNL